MRSLLCIFSLIILTQRISSFSKYSLDGDENIHFMEHGDVKIFKARPRRTIEFFCYLGKPKYMTHTWRSVVLQVNYSSDHYRQFEGSDPEAVNEAYFSNRYSWFLSNLYSSKHVIIKLDPFSMRCVGIDNKDPFTVQLNVIRIDIWKLLQLGIGVLIFISAEKLSTNTVFHYICGILLGICVSCLILIYLASKMIPRNPIMYGVLGIGWTVALYVVQRMRNNITTILMDCKCYLLLYTVMAGFISFIMCYRWGPVENARTINLIKWVLQILALVLIFFSSHYQESAMAQIVLLIASRFIPKKWIDAPKTYWKKKFPPKIKLLDNNEYYEQGVRETAKSLEELREFCAGPDCNQWKTALKVNDVKRFASFVEGNSHLSDEELLEYETSQHAEFTDDERTDEDEQNV